MLKTPSSIPRPASASATKRISIDHLKPGMFLVGVYQSWWKSPFFRHNRLIRSRKEVEMLLNSGIKEVMIDCSRGLDVDDNNAAVADETSLDGSGAEAGVGDSETAVRNSKRTGTSVSDECVSHKASERIRNDAIDAVAGIFEGVKTGEIIDQPKLQQTVQSLLQQVLSDGQAMVEAILIQNIRQFDKALYGHVVDVSVLSIMVGIQLNMNDEALEALALGGLLHDVGYVRIPRNVLRRKHNPIGEEQALLDRHVEFGRAILECCPTIPQAVHRVVAEHHERQDGSGYPERLRANDISDLSDVVGFIDQFDALVSEWGPPPCLPTALAIRKLFQQAQAGKLRSFPVEALIRCLGVYPLGSLVSLSTGARAVVWKTNANDRMKPSVKIITDEQGHPCDVPRIEDLSVPDPRSGDVSICDILDPSSVKIDVGKYFRD